MTSYFFLLVSPFSYCHIFASSHLNLITSSHLQMFTPSSLHITHLYIFTSLHTHQYLFMCALYIYIFFLSDIFISFPLSYISRYTPLRSRAIRRLVQIWLCLFLTCANFSRGRMFDLRESYPRIIPRIIPPNHTPESYPPKITILNVSCRIVWDCIGLTSFNGTDLTS